MRCPECRDHRAVTRTTKDSIPWWPDSEVCNWRCSKCNCEWDEEYGTYFFAPCSCGFSHHNPNLPEECEAFLRKPWELRQWAKWTRNPNGSTPEDNVERIAFLLTIGVIRVVALTIVILMAPLRWLQGLPRD